MLGPEPERELPAGRQRGAVGRRPEARAVAEGEPAILRRHRGQEIHRRRADEAGNEDGGGGLVERPPPARLLRGPRAPRAPPGGAGPPPPPRRRPLRSR